MGTWSRKQSSFKTDWDKVQNCSVVRWIRTWNSVWKSWSSRLKRRGTILLVISSQFKACISDGMGGDWLKPAFPDVQVLEQHLLPSRQRLLQGRPCIFQQDRVKPHPASIPTARLRSRRVRVLDWPAAVQTWKHEDPGTLHQTGMGQRSSPKESSSSPQLCCCYHQIQDELTFFYEIVKSPF